MESIEAFDCNKEDYFFQTNRISAAEQQKNKEEEKSKYSYRVSVFWEENKVTESFRLNLVRFVLQLNDNYYCSRNDR